MPCPRNRHALLRIAGGPAQGLQQHCPSPAHAEILAVRLEQGIVCQIRSGRLLPRHLGQNAEVPKLGEVLWATRL
eukprot:1569754-Alexandrium_andersonii.AAC.1